MNIIHGELARIKIFLRPFIIRKYFKNHKKAYLHLGCGTTLIPQWLNVDKFSSVTDIWMDATSKWPFSSDSFDLIYSEHMIEHIFIDHIEFFLREAFRTLKPGGGIRITTPDLEIHAKNYVEKNDAFFVPIIEKYMKRWDKQKNKYWLIRSNGGAFMSRAVQRFYRHRWMYDFETLSSCLKEIGFENITHCSFKTGNMPLAYVLDSEERAFETLYVEATKPLAI